MTAFDNNTASQADMWPANIFPHHRAELERSGIDGETARAARIYSEANISKVLALLECKRFSQRCLPAMVFPFVDAEGRNGYARIKPDNPRLDNNKKPIKYESPRGRRNEIYLPPGVAEKLATAERELLVTEGEKKSLCATQNGFPCIGLVGVFGWKPAKSESLIPALDRIAWKGRRVFVCFDSDINEKSEVQDAESRLASQLQKRGAIVKVTRLPNGPNGAKMGLDDFIVAHGIGELRKLLDSADDPTPPDSVAIKKAASEIDAGPEADVFLTKTERDGVRRLRFHRGGFLYWTHGAYIELPPSDVRGKLIEHLDDKFSKLNASATNNVLDCVKAKCRLSHLIESPAWIGDHPGPWPADEILATKNALVHLPSLIDGKEGYLQVPTPRFFTTNALDYEFDAIAPEPRAWMQFTASLWPDDPQAVAALQEWMGYCLTPDTRQQKIFFLIGPKRSGKGTIARVLRALVGSANVAGPTLASIATNFGLWPLLGKSLAIISDARLSGRTDGAIVVERLLSISGEDALTVDRKNLEPITCKLNARIMMLTNELPRLGDASGALTSRMIVVRMTESFFGKEDHDLTDRLLKELPGILLWSIAGWQRLRNRGHFIHPDSSLEMMGEFHDLASPISQFIRECCIVDVAATVSRSAIYDRYAEWARAAGKKHIDDEAGFGRNLRAALPGLRDSQPRVEGKQIRHYVGVGLQ
jgi:putative DNA primase/helicase